MRPFCTATVSTCSGHRRAPPRDQAATPCAASSSAHKPRHNEGLSSGFICVRLRALAKLWLGSVVPAVTCTASSAGISSRLFATRDHCPACSRRASLGETTVRACHCCQTMSLVPPLFTLLNCVAIAAVPPGLTATRRGSRQFLPACSPADSKFVHPAHSAASGFPPPAPSSTHCVSRHPATWL